MPILTARQPDGAQVVDTRGLVKDAISTIQNELAARTDLGKAFAAGQQQDFINAAQLRTEINQDAATRFTQDRLLRTDELSRRIQIAQDARSERELKLREELQPLAIQGKRLDLAMGAFNLSSAQAKLPIQLSGAALDNATASQNLANNQAILPIKMEGAALDNAAEAQKIASSVATGNVAAAEAPVRISKAAEEMQRINLGATAKGSLGNVKNMADFNGWVDSQFPNLPGSPSEKRAAVGQFLEGSGWSDSDKARARATADSAVNNLRISDGNSASILPQAGFVTAHKMLAQNSTSMRDERGKGVFLGDIPMADVNAARADLGMNPFSSAEYAALPKSPNNSAEVRQDTATAQLQARTLLDQATALMKRSNELLRADDKAGAQKAFEDAQALYRRAETITPGSPGGGAAPSTPASAVTPQGINPRRAAALQVH